jgi:alpha-1,6-mannosyltransferase
MLAGRSGETATLLFRAAAAVAVLLTTALAIRLARRKAFAAAFIGLNPLLAIQFAGGGHNDALMVAALLGALLLFERRSDAAGGALWIAAAAIKIVALPLLALRLARARRAMFAGAITAAVGIALASTLVFGAAWLSALGSIANRHAAASIPAQLAAAGLGKPVAFGLADAALLAGAAWLTVEALRGRQRLALGACILLVTTPWLLPWYAIWPTALAAVEEDALAQIVALSLSAYLLPDRVPV